MRFSGTFTKTVAGVLVLLCGVFLCWAWIPGRMTGGGSVFLGTMRVTHGFEIHCSEDGPNNTVITPGPNNLEINWGGGNNFHLTSLTQGHCFMNDSINPPNPPNAPFNTFVGVGVGTFNNEAGATINFVFTDVGEPGTGDTAEYHIKRANNTPVLDVPATALTFGNHQAHKDNQ